MHPECNRHDLAVRQLASLVLHLGQEREHVVPGIAPLFVRLLLEVLLELHEGLRVLDLLGGRELVPVVDEVDEAADLRFLECLESWHVLERQPENRRDHALRERLRMISTTSPF